MFGYKYIDKSTLQVGDVVGVPFKTMIGYGTFRYDTVKQETITRITPSRTKFVTDNEYSYKASYPFIEITPEVERRTFIAKQASEIYSMGYKLDKAIQEKINELDDNSIYCIHQLLSEALDMIKHN